MAQRHEEGGRLMSIAPTITASPVANQVGRGASVCERGYDRAFWTGHPESSEGGDDPFLGQGDPRQWPSYRALRRVIADRAAIGERAWAYRELAEIAGLHEAKLTNGLVAMKYFGELTEPHVVFCDPGPNATMRRDYILHAFCVPGGDDELSKAKEAMLGRLSDRGLLVHYMAASVRIGVPRALRAGVWAKTGGRCWYCGDETNPYIDFRVDHLKAVARGGSNDDENLVPACHPCNASKAAMSLEQFRAKRGGGLFWFEERGMTP